MSYKLFLLEWGLSISFALWWIAGTTAAIYAWREEMDITVGVFIASIAVGLLAGPLGWLAVFLNKWEMPTIVIFKRREGSKRG